MENENKEYSMLEKCGLLLIVFAARENLPLSPINFQNRIGDMESLTGLKPEELREVYQYVQKESFRISLPRERGKLGFSAQP